MSHFRIGFFGLVVLALAAMLNLAAFYMVERSFGELRDAATWLGQSQDTQKLIERLYRKAVDAETGQRGYLLTQDATFLRPYADARRDIPGDLERLREATRDNPVQVAQFATVESLLEARFAQMDRTLALKRDDDDDAVRKLLRSHQGMVTMDALRLALDGIAAEEKMRYERRIRSYGENQHQVRAGSLVLVGLNLFLVTLGALFLSQDSRRRRRETTEARDRAARLAQRVEERTAELLGLTHYLQKVREEEKAAVAREIHDELGGTLVAAKIDLQLLSDHLESGDPQRARFDRVMAAIDDTIQIKRRIIENLRPSLLDSLGIGPALKWQCAEFSKRLDLPCRVELSDEDLRLSPDYSIALYRVVQEALTNVSKYAHAKNVAVSLQRDGEHWVLRIADDGIGFDTGKQHHATAHGLLSMRERARALGGEFSVQKRSGRGTIVEVRVPIEKEGGGQLPRQPTPA